MISSVLTTVCDPVRRRQTGPGYGELRAICAEEYVREGAVAAL